MLSDNEIMAEFEAAEAILRGHFILSSGLHSDTYLQCARVLMNPKRADKLCAALAKKLLSQLGGQPIELVVAPAMGGVVVGYEMGRQLGVETIFCEREAGEFTLRRGFRIEPGMRVLMVEDVVTTGKSSMEAVACVEKHGGGNSHGR
jgi:orotate phosphoribosyltransferase